MNKLKEGLKQGKKFATKQMIKNGDYIYLKGNTVIRTWRGCEQVIGDKYFSWGKLEWIEVSDEN